MYGEALLTPTNIYAELIQKIQTNKIDLHYISNLTGHGLRKIMRARSDFSYNVDHIFKPQEVFSFMQKTADVSDYEMYQTFNMGQDYAIFIDKKDVIKTQKIIRSCGFQSLDAGYVTKGQRQVIIKEKNIVYDSEAMNLR